MCGTTGCRSGPRCPPAACRRATGTLVKFSVRQVAGQPNFPAGQGVQGVLVFRPLYPDTYSNSLETTYPCDSTSWCDYAIAFKASDTHTNANPPG